MLNLDAVPKHYEEAVRLLVDWHRDPDDGSFAAYSFPDPQEVLVRLVEVSDRFPTVEEIRPVSFGRSVDFPFPSAVALVSPQDWERVNNGSLALPAGWPLKTYRQVWPHDQE